MNAPAVVIFERYRCGMYVLTSDSFLSLNDLGVGMYVLTSDSFLSLNDLGVGMYV